MSGLTGKIEHFLLDLLDKSEDGTLEIGRNELAEYFNCAPSQINYVLKSRFTSYKGYYIESRRGGSGYIRISRMEMPEDDLVQSLLNQVINSDITSDKAKHVLNALYEQEALNLRERDIMIHAVDDNALRCVPAASRNHVRASIMKNMLLVFLL